MSSSKEQMIQWCVKNPKKVMLAAAKRRARLKNLPFDLEPNDFDIPCFCPVLGLKLERNTHGKSKLAQDNSPSLDKIRPQLGYIKGNVRVISWRANKLKTDASSKELRLVVEDLESLGL